MSVRIGVDATGLAVGGGVTWLRRLVPALAATAPAPELVVFLRRGVAPDWDPGPGVTLSRRRVGSGAARMFATRLLVPRWTRAAGCDALLCGADAGPARAPCPMVQVVHNLRVYARDERRYRWLARAARATARAAKATVFVSEAVRAVAEPRLAPRTSVVIPHGVTPPPADPGARPREAAYVLAVGTPYAHKDLATALDAVLALRRRGRREALVVAGGGGDAAVVADLVRRAAADPAALVLVGEVASDALEAWYAHASAFVLPSREESSGMSLAEALARGVPCAAADLPALRETAAGSAAWFPPGSVDAAARAIERAVEDPATPDERSRRGARYAVERTWARAAQRYLEVLTA